MNILFLSLIDFESLDERNIYTDLMREFAKHDHNLYLISPCEWKTGKKTCIKKEGKITILKPRIGNIQKNGVIEKGISMITLEGILIHNIKKYFSNILFDLILYPTPPVTFGRAVSYVKKRDRAKTYLILKDIFPEGTIDFGVLSKRGIKGLIYRYFRSKERKLYRISDHIGCLSPANVNYILAHNDIDPQKVEVCPNSIEPIDVALNEDERKAMRLKYGIPLDKRVFVYGGNLGIPQGIPFLIQCLKSQFDNDNNFFLIVGEGTEFPRLETYIRKARPKNVKLMRRLPKEDYDHMIAACDVGLIFLDYRCSVPNFPSRLLVYMQARLPVLAVTDPHTDIGKIIVEGGFGWWCESNSVRDFVSLIREVEHADCSSIGEKGFEYLVNHYSVEQSYEIIMKNFAYLR